MFHLLTEGPLMMGDGFCDNSKTFEPTAEAFFVEAKSIWRNLLRTFKDWSWGNGFLGKAHLHVSEMAGLTHPLPNVSNVGKKSFVILHWINWLMLKGHGSNTACSRFSCETPGLWGWKFETGLSCSVTICFLSLCTLSSWWWKQREKELLHPKNFTDSWWNFKFTQHVLCRFCANCTQHVWKTKSCFCFVSTTKNWWCHEWWTICWNVFRLFSKC